MHARTRRGDRLAATIGAMALIIAAPALAAGQPETVGELDADATLDLREPEEAGAGIGLAGRVFGRHEFEADLDTAGDVSTTRAGAAIDAWGAINESLRLETTLQIESSFYEFNDAQVLLAGSDGPIDEGYDLLLRPILRGEVNERWGWLAGLQLRLSGEADADIEDAAGIGGFAGVTRHFSDRFSLTLGAGAQSRLEDSAIVIPYIAFDWRPTEDLRVWSDGLGVHVSREIDESWSARAFARYESREFRLDDDGPIPDGVFRDDIVLLGVGTTWAPASSRMTVAFDLGASIYRDMDVLDAGGDEIVDTEQVDPAFFLSARLEYRF